MRSEFLFHASCVRCVHPLWPGLCKNSARTALAGASALSAPSPLTHTSVIAFSFCFPSCFCRNGNVRRRRRRRSQKSSVLSFFIVGSTNCTSPNQAEAAATDGSIETRVFVRARRLIAPQEASSNNSAVSSNYSTVVEILANDDMT